MFEIFASSDIGANFGKWLGIPGSSKMCFKSRTNKINNSKNNNIMCTFGAIDQAGSGTHGSWALIIIPCITMGPFNRKCSGPCDNTNNLSKKTKAVAFLCFGDNNLYKNIRFLAPKLLGTI